MMSLSSPENTIQTAMRLVDSDENSHIRINANGGNSILIVCEPIKEIDYINTIQKLMTTDKYEIIDLNHVLCEFVAENKEDIKVGFDLLRGSIHQIFKTPNGEEGTDLLGLILQAISDTLNTNRIPVLINAGSLYGSGINNIHIMESDLVMRACLPLLILYPATREQDKLLYLGKRSASKYRCMIVD